MLDPICTRYDGFYLVPLPFSSEMVRANCDGLKTATRRPAGSAILRNAQEALKQRLNVVGWVREAWQATYATEHGTSGDYFDLTKQERDRSTISAVRYRADEELRGAANSIRWVPAMHMPFERNRLFMRITAIDLVRLGDISEQDAVDEGVSACIGRVSVGFHPSAVSLFQSIWSASYGVWNADQMVYRISYERPIAGPVSSYIEVYQEIAA
ncbi:hypothetical protein [Thalassospira profundimaris]|uniref:Uncharacterized protein n=1 Tax=Thalassospira profundimaris TaxID=502049 RepID=A0A367WPS1_9PROT|nr:hypothetical protein [Thalassospira profundimaris]RCK43199.1 hypothetical protein TH30_19465 [Thalassospira profundimaris]